MALEPALPCAPRGNSGEGTGRVHVPGVRRDGLLLNASLQRAWTDGLLTERRRCSLARRSERQAELEPFEKCERRAQYPWAGRGARGDGSPGRWAHTPRGWTDAPGAEPTHPALPGSAQHPPPPTLLFLVQWNRAVHWEEQRAGEDSETHTQIHRDNLVPGSRLREQTCTPLL